MIWDIHHRDREYAATVGDPILGRVMADTKERAEEIALKAGLCGTAGAWAVESDKKALEGAKEIAVAVASKFSDEAFKATVREFSERKSRHGIDLLIVWDENAVPPIRREELVEALKGLASVNGLTMERVDRKKGERS